MNLYELKPGETACCCGVDCKDLETKRRLLEMGFCNSTCIEMLRKQGLICCKVRGYCLALREAEAKAIQCKNKE